MNFKEFAEQAELFDDMMQAEVAIQHEIKVNGVYVIAYHRYAEMYAKKYPEYMGYVQLEDSQSLFIVGGKVHYQAKVSFPSGIFLQVLEE